MTDNAHAFYKNVYWIPQSHDKVTFPSYSVFKKLLKNLILKLIINFTI
jgi:hypothetical protein